MLNGNIFRQAKALLQTKSTWEMNEEEVLTVKAAMIPLTILPEFNDMTTDEGLEELARLFDEATGYEETAPPQEVHPDRDTQRVTGK